MSRAAPVVPPGPEAASLAEARALAAQCRRCELWRGATQTVFGEGPASATVVLVGEQPGDKEDLQGHPFVGPAGGMLDRALAEAEIDRAQAYVTNAVKHFKNVPRGRKRIHQRPDRHEIEICRWWLDLELSFVRPRLVVALGASAARALFLRTVTITRERGPCPSATVSTASSPSTRRSSCASGRTRTGGGNMPRWSRTCAGSLPSSAPEAGPCYLLTAPRVRPRTM